MGHNKVFQIWVSIFLVRDSWLPKLPKQCALLVTPASGWGSWESTGSLFPLSFHVPGQTASPWDCGWWQDDSVEQGKGILRYGNVWDEQSDFQISASYPAGVGRSDCSDRDGRNIRFLSRAKYWSQVSVQPMESPVPAGQSQWWPFPKNQDRPMPRSSLWLPPCGASQFFHLVTTW